MKLITVLAIVTLLVIGIAYPKSKKETYFQPTDKSFKLIHTLKDKKGNILGKVYVSYFKDDIFKKLLIIKEKNGASSILYSINNTILKNSKGIDTKVGEKDFNGYKMEKLNNDSIKLFCIGSATSGASDPILIEWNYDEKVFKVFFTP